MKISKSTIFEIGSINFAYFFLIFNGLKIEKNVSFREKEIASRL